MNIRSVSSRMVWGSLGLLQYLCVATLEYGPLGAQPATGQTEMDRPFVELRRCKLYLDGAYMFDFEDPLKKGSPVFAVLKEGDDGGAISCELARYYVFGVAMVDGHADTLRWDATPEYLFASTVQGRPGLHVSAGLGRYPIEALRPNLDMRDMLDRSHPKAQPMDPEKPMMTRAPGFSGLGPVWHTLMRFRWNPKRADSSSHGWEPSSVQRIPVVEYDIRATDDWHVELLMTVDGRPSVWRLEADPGVPKGLWKWTRLVEYPSTIGGPFLWMQNPQYVVAERDGQWCVIGPLDAEDPDIRPIVKKNPDLPLYLVEDVHAGRDYFRIGEQLLDGRGLRIGTIDVSESPDDQLREVVAKVVSRRE